MRNSNHNEKSAAALIKKLGGLETRLQELGSEYQRTLAELVLAPPVTGGLEVADAAETVAPSSSTTVTEPKPKPQPTTPTTTGGGSNKAKPPTAAGSGGTVRKSILEFMAAHRGQKVGLEDVLRAVTGAKDRRQVLSTLANLKDKKVIRGVGRGHYRLG